MKKLKFTLAATILLCIMLFLLAGCAGGSKPSKSQVLEDLRTSFANNFSSRAENMDIEKFEVELSESGEEEYTATLNVIAKSKSKYAELYWTAYVEYTKYDQGWKIENCDWVYDDYKVIKYPSEKEISEIVKYLKGQSTTVEEIEILKDESKIVCRIRDKVDWNKYAAGEAVSNLTLTYSRDNDAWTQYGLDEYIENDFVLNTLLAGKYTLKEGKYVGSVGDWGAAYRYTKYGDYENGYITIGNVTEKGLDIACKAETDRLIKLHFELDSVRFSNYQINLYFKTTEKVAMHTGTVNPTLQISLNSRTVFYGDKNGDVEIELEMGGAIAYANTADN